MIQAEQLSATEVMERLRDDTDSNGKATRHTILKRLHYMRRGVLHFLQSGRLASGDQA